MPSYKLILVLLSIITIVSCNTKKEDTKVETVPISVNKKPSKSQSILNKTIIAHGGNLYNSAYYAFNFRGNEYRFKNNGTDYEYWKEVQTDSNVLVDYLKNNVLFRSQFNKSAAEPVNLSAKETKSAIGALNSVIYFATLPHKLNDKAVNSKYIENTIIKGITYDVVEITFNKEGGGEDHDDEFYYWINTNTNKIDYLAYNYKVNKGGVRFRSAYNTRIINGITFQDYINYKAEIGTPLKNLPALFEAGKLKELSRIKTENINNLNKN